ncbi:MAG: Na/Pi symporter [Hyphomicrobium sp.]
MLTFLNIFAGFGLFFVGVKNISTNLKQLSSEWLKQLIEKATKNLFSSSCIGLLSGALTQSSNAITFISISMVTAGLIELTRVVPMLIWANVGTSALVLLSAININLFVLFLVGTIGLAYYFEFDRIPNYRHFLGSLLGIGLLFMGLDLIKIGATPLKTSTSLQEFIEFSSNSYLLDFLIGLILTMVAQSSATIAIITVTMINIGILKLDQAIIIVLGSSLGSGLSIGLLSMNLSGIGRQIALLQVVVKSVGVFFTIILLLPEYVFSIPGILFFLNKSSFDPAVPVAFFYFLLQMISAIIVTRLRLPIEKILAKLSPPTTEEALSKPHYIYHEALGDPSSALILIEKEQLRLFNFVTQLVSSIRSEGAKKVSSDTLRSAALSLSEQCAAFLKEIIDRSGSRSTLDAALDLQKRQELVHSLILTVDEYVSIIAKAHKRQIGDKLSNLLFALGESLDTILLLAQDAFQSRTSEDMSLLLDFTSDRSGQMESIRKRIMTFEEINLIDHQTLYTSTTLFERTLWLIRKYAMTIKQEGRIEGVAG